MKIINDFYVSIFSIRYKITEDIRRSHLQVHHSGYSYELLQKNLSQHLSYGTFDRRHDVGFQYEKNYLSFSN